MQVSIQLRPSRGLPATASRRLAQLGYGATVGRAQLVAAFGSRRAADLFINKWVPAGVLVPLAWGSYWIPDEKTLFLLGAARVAHHARLIATSAALRGPLRRLKSAGFLGPVLWQESDLSVPSLGLTIALRPTDEDLKPVAPQLEPFFCDLGWPLSDGEVSLGALGKVRIPLVAPADVAWILQLNFSARLRAAGERLEATQGPPARSRIRELRRLAHYPALAPPPSRAHKIPRAGPPHHRVFAPRWYMGPHLAALQAQAGRQMRT